MATIGPDLITVNAVFVSRIVAIFTVHLHKEFSKQEQISAQYAMENSYMFRPGWVISTIQSRNYLCFTLKIIAFGQI